MEKLTVDLSTAKKTVTQLEKALQKNNATLVEERELFEKQLIVSTRTTHTHTSKALNDFPERTSVNNASI